MFEQDNIALSKATALIVSSLHAHGVTPKWLHSTFTTFILLKALVCSCAQALSVLCTEPPCMLTGDAAKQFVQGMASQSRCMLCHLQDNGDAASFPLSHRIWLSLPFMHSENLGDQQVRHTWRSHLQTAGLTLHLIPKVGREKASVYPSSQTLCSAW